MEIHNSATIHRVNFENHFTILHNSAAENPRLSWGAKGLLWYLLSRPKNWNVKVHHLAKIYCGELRGNGKEAIWSLLNELKSEGYLQYTKSRDAKGRFIHRYD